MKYLNRAKASNQLEMASAMRAAQTTQDDYKQWRNEIEEEAI
jgi:hypothetical protein